MYNELINSQNSSNDTIFYLINEVLKKLKNFLLTMQDELINQQLYLSIQ